MMKVRIIKFVLKTQIKGYKNYTSPTNDLRHKDDQEYIFDEKGAFDIPNSE